MSKGATPHLHPKGNYPLIFTLPLSCQLGVNIRGKVIDQESSDDLPMQLYLLNLQQMDDTNYPLLFVQYYHCRIIQNFKIYLEVFSIDTHPTFHLIFNVTHHNGLDVM